MKNPFQSNEFDSEQLPIEVNGSKSRRIQPPFDSSDETDTATLKAYKALDEEQEKVTEVEPVKAKTTERAEEDKKKDNRLLSFIKKPSTIIASTVVVVIVVVLFVLFVLNKSIVPKALNTLTENGQTLALTGNNSACSEFVNNGLKCEAEMVTDSNAPRNQLISQSIKDGEIVKRGTDIKLVYSKGPDKTTLPTLSGKDQKDAANTVFSLGGNVQKAISVANANFQKDNVIKVVSPDCKSLDSDPMSCPALPANQEFDNGFNVVFLVFNGERTAPDFTMKSKEQASADASSNGWKLNFVEEESDATAGTTIKQDPAAGSSVDSTNNTITVTIAKPKASQSIVVPDVIGKSSSDAVSIFASSGFKKVNVMEAPSSCDTTGNPVVIQVSPNVGQTSLSTDNLVVLVSKPGTNCK